MVGKLLMFMMLFILAAMLSFSPFAMHQVQGSARTMLGLTFLRQWASQTCYAVSERTILSVRICGSGEREGSSEDQNGNTGGDIVAHFHFSLHISLQVFSAPKL